MYCISNSTNDYVTIVVPSGLEFDSSLHDDNYIVHKITPAGFRFISLQHEIPPIGIYTCRVFSPQKKLLEMSFRIYSSPIGELSAGYIMLL